MNDSVLGIVITFIVLGLVLSIGLVAHGGVELPSIEEKKIPNITSSTKTTNAYSEWCYKMNIDCS